MGGMNETEIPKSRGVSGVKGVGHAVGSLRAHTNGDVVHFHDDNRSLRFAYVGVRNFQLGIDTFLKHRQHECAVGTVGVIRGEDAESSGRKPADLVLTLTSEGWEISLAPVGETREAYVIADPILSALDDFVQRI